MTTNTTERLIKGDNVGGEVLAVVCKTENVSISWILEGKGTPYLVHYANTDEEAVLLLEQFIEDEPGWSVYQLQGPCDRLAIVLTQPARFERKGDWIDYTELEVIVGDAGDRTRAVLNETNHDLDRHWLGIDDRTWKRLQAGQLGTWHLVGDDENPGLLAGGQLDMTLGEGGCEHKSPLSEEAKRLGRWFDNIPESRRAALLAFLELGDERPE